MEGLVNGIYRTWIPMQALAYRGHTVHVEERNVVDRPEGLFEYDVVHFCRCLFPHMEQLARRLKEAGVGIVWDNDDDLTAIPRNAPEYRRFGGLSGQRIFGSMVNMMRLADIVTTPSVALAERYRDASGADVRVLENYLPPTFERPARVPVNTGVVVGWHGGREHRYDLDTLTMRTTLERLLRRHPHISVASVGLKLGLRSHRYEWTQFMDYGHLPERLARFDIGIAPLADAPFNRARSNVKLKELSAVGVPWLASPVGPYEAMGEEQGGLLVEDDAWYREIERLIVDAELRRRLAYRARRWGDGQRIEAHVDQWEQVLSEAADRARSTARSR